MAIAPFGTVARDVSQPFGITFCEVLRHLGPEHGKWGSCDLYLESAPTDAPAATEEIPRDVGVVVVGGIFPIASRRTIFMPSHTGWLT